jgi:hypothetical protein
MSFGYPGLDSHICTCVYCWNSMLTVVGSVLDWVTPVALLLDTLGVVLLSLPYLTKTEIPYNHLITFQKSVFCVSVKERCEKI